MQLPPVLVELLFIISMLLNIGLIEARCSQPFDTFLIVNYFLRKQ